jgi:hypothetical protein
VKTPSPIEHEDRTGCTACMSGVEALEHEARIAEIAACRAAFETGGRDAVSRLVMGTQQGGTGMTSAERTRLLEAVGIVSEVGVRIGRISGRAEPTAEDGSEAFEALCEQMPANRALELIAEHTETLRAALVVGMCRGALRGAA